MKMVMSLLLNFSCVTYRKCDVIIVFVLVEGVLDIYVYFVP